MTSTTVRAEGAPPDPACAKGRCSGNLKSIPDRYPKTGFTCLSEPPRVRQIVRRDLMSSKSRLTIDGEKARQTYTG